MGLGTLAVVMAALLVGSFIVIASSFGFGLALFHRPALQPATAIADAPPRRDDRAVVIPSPTPVDIAEPRPWPDRADEAGLGDTGPLVERSPTAPARPIRISPVVRVRSGLLLALAVLIAALIVGTLLSAIVVLIGLLVQ